MDTCSVPWCSNPTADAAVCALCLGRLRADLVEVAELVNELDNQVARLGTTGTWVGSRSAEFGLPFNLGAAEVRDDLRNTLSTWVRDLWETHGPRRQAPSAVDELVHDDLDLDDTVPEMAAWLRRHPSWVADHPAAGELVDEILDAVERVRRAVDLAPERLYCGPCPDCGAELNARPDRAMIVCRECESRHDVELLRAGLLNAVREEYATAAEAARALPRLLGRELSVNTVRTWARAGKLTRRIRDERGRPRYQLGEVIDLALTTQTRSRVTP